MTDSPTYLRLTLEGLWKNNPALVQLLGLCPLLAVSASVVNAMGLGLATLLVLTCSNIVVSMIRNVVAPAIRLPVFVMIIAAFTTCTELLMQAFNYELYQILGIFIPLIVTNCTILGRADSFACKNPVLPSAVDGFMMGLGFGLALVALGGMRELLGTGALFGDMHLLLGPVAADWKWTLIPDYPGFLIALVPPGAFICAGFLIALKNLIDNRIQALEARRRAQPVAGSKRVRVTGAIS